MPRIPDATAIPRDPSQNAYRAQSYTGGIAEAGLAKMYGTIADADLATAQGAERGTANLVKAGEGILDERDQAQILAARSKFLQAKVQADNAFDNDPDHGTWEQRYQDQLYPQAQAAADGISSERARNKFLNEVGPVYASGVAKIRDASRIRVNAEGAASASDTVSSILRDAERASDQPTRDGLLESAFGVITQARASGFYTPAEEEARREFVRGSFDKNSQANFESSLDTRIDGGAARVFSDPNNLPDALLELNQYVDKYGVTTATAQKAKNKINETLTANYYQSLMRSDPLGVAARLQAGESPQLDANHRSILINSANTMAEHQIAMSDHGRRIASQNAANDIYANIFRQVDASTGGAAPAAATDPNAQQRAAAAQMGLPAEAVSKIFGPAPTQPQPAPPITELSIATNPTLFPETKSMLIGVLRQAMAPDAPAAVSRATSIDLYKQIHAPVGDPQKISTLAPIQAQFAAGKLTKPDLDWLTKQFTEAQSDDGSLLGRTKASFLKLVEPSINRSNPMGGSISPVGMRNFYTFMRDTDTMIDAYRKAGKDPNELFDPRNPQYLGRADVLSKYRPTQAQESAEMIDAIRTARPTGPIAPPVTPALPSVLPQRRPGESPDDYLKRVGAP